MQKRESKGFETGWFPYVRIDDVHKWLGISGSTIRELIKKGKLNKYNIPGTSLVFVRKDELISIIVPTGIKDNAEQDY